MLLKKGFFKDQVNDGTEIKMLTWKQPYGFLMLPPNNKIETRVWDTHYRGWVLIHASKKQYEWESVMNISGWNNCERIENAITGQRSLIKSSCGYAFAIGYIYATHPMYSDSHEQKTFVSKNQDLFCHLYDGVHPIKPIALQGKQGWGKVTNETFQQIEIVDNFMDK